MWGGRGAAGSGAGRSGQSALRANRTPDAGAGAAVSRGRSGERGEEKCGARSGAMPSLPLRTERCCRGASPPAAVLSLALQMASRSICKGQKQRRSEGDNRATRRNVEKAEGCVHQTQAPRSEADSPSTPRPSKGRGLMLESSEQDSSMDFSRCDGQPIPEGIATLQPLLPHPTSLPRRDQLQPHLSSTFQAPSPGALRPKEGCSLPPRQRRTPGPEVSPWGQRCHSHQLPAECCSCH